MEGTDEPQPSCGRCSARVQLNEERCPTCGSFAGYPNVKLAFSERPVLLERSSAARGEANQVGCQGPLEALEAKGLRSHAVVNVYAEFAHHLLTRQEALYASYESLVSGGARRTASPDNDRDRRAVGAKLYGHGAAEIIYAALSFNGKGLTSYGPVSLSLRELAIEHRATVLEENSYNFARNSQLGLLGPLPRGHIAVWYDRLELIVAKLAPLLQPDTSGDDLNTLIMRSEGDRNTDEFLEVHIWGGFDRRAIESVHVAALTGHYEQSEQILAEHLLALAKDKTEKKGMLWSES